MSDASNQIELTDQQKVDDYRKRLTDAAAPFVAIMAEAVADGFNVAINIEGNPPVLKSVDFSKNVKF